MTGKHTEGPKILRDKDGTVWIEASKASGFATCGFGHPEDDEDAARCERTARLYAAAPAMLEALREIADYLAPNSGDPLGCADEAYETARAALAGVREGVTK